MQAKLLTETQTCRNMYCITFSVISHVLECTSCPRQCSFHNVLLLTLLPVACPVSNVLSCPMAPWHMHTHAVVAKLVVPCTREHGCRYTDDPSLIADVDVGCPMFYIAHAWDNPFELIVTRLDGYLSGTCWLAYVSPLFVTSLGLRRERPVSVLPNDNLLLVPSWLLSRVVEEGPPTPQ